MFTISQFINNNVDTLYYIIGQCIAEIMISPLYTVITVYQTSKNKTIRQVVYRIYKKDSFFGFYSSVQFLLLSRLIGSGLKYCLYQNFKYYNGTTEENYFINMFGSCLSGCVGGMIGHPFDVMANYKQRRERIPRNINLLLSGMMGTYARNVVLYSFLFSTYDYIKYHSNNVYLACALTTTLTTTLTSPIEYVRTNVMTSKIKYQDIKWQNLYRGYTLNLPRNMLHFMITMKTVEFFKTYNS
jgi:Mitochondrial carrier protein